MERKLAAIVAGDIVGYSRLMAEDEAATYWSCALPSTTSSGRRWSAMAAGLSRAPATGFWRLFRASTRRSTRRSRSRPALRTALQLRIGVNLGDVIEDNGDMFGDGVNVAARLEAMAEPGSIFVSAAVVRSADRSRGEPFYRIGRRHAKNIPEPSTSTR